MIWIAAVNAYHTTNWVTYPHGVYLDPYRMDEIVHWCQQQWNPEDYRVCITTRSIACSTHAQAVELMVTWGDVI